MNKISIKPNYTAEENVKKSIFYSFKFAASFPWISVDLVHTSAHTTNRMAFTEWPSNVFIVYFIYVSYYANIFQYYSAVAVLYVPHTHTYYSLSWKTYIYLSDGRIFYIEYFSKYSYHYYKENFNFILLWRLIKCCKYISKLKIKNIYMLTA